MKQSRTRVLIVNPGPPRIPEDGNPRGDNPGLDCHGFADSPSQRRTGSEVRLCEGILARDNPEISSCLCEASEAEAIQDSEFRYFTFFTLRFTLPDMDHAFRLEIGRKGSKLALLDGERVVSSREWPEARDMGQQLFEAIDGLLRESGVASTDVTHFTIETDIPESFTSVRIAQSVAKAWEYGAKAD